MTSDYFGQPGDSGWDGTGSPPKAAAAPHKHPLPIPSAGGTTYDPSVSGLVDTSGNPVQNAQDAIDVLAAGGSAGTIFDITNYGAVGDGLTDATAGINAAIAALNTAARGILYAPGGSYLCSGALTPVSATAIIRGDGANSYDNLAVGTEIVCSSASSGLFTINGKAGRVEKITLRNSAATPTAGSAVLVDGSYIGQRVDFEEVSVYGFYDGLDVKVGAQWVAHAVNVTGPARYGIRIRNTVNADAGDWAISDSAIYSQARNAASAIRIESSGGGKIANVKINAGTDAHYFTNGIDLAGTATTVILLIANSSIENMAAGGYGVRLAPTGGSWKGISIVGCEFGMWANSATPILLDGSGGGALSYFVIDNILALGARAVYVVNLNSVSHGTVGKIEHDGYSGKLTQTGSSNITDNTGSAAVVYGLPALTLGTAASAGATDEAIRRDATIAAFDATAPVTQAFGDAAATGSAAVAARRDHKHGMPAAPSSSAHYLVISSTHSSPLVFDDIVQSSAGDDFVYTS